MRVIRVFPRRTKASPDDALAYFGPPDLFAEADEVHVSVTFTADKAIAERLAEQWRPVAPVKIGGVAYGDTSLEFIPGRYIRPERPPKSACTFCPYHDNAQWREMKATDPEAFAQAVKIDEAIRPGMPGPKRPKCEAWFVHRERVPLAEVDFRTAAELGQPDLFNNECEGMCGV